jgi:hypothetical protein
MLDLSMFATHNAMLKFPNQPVRVWYAMLGSKSWKAIVINTDTKERLCESLFFETQEECCKSITQQLDQGLQKVL